ncbi:VaFE repeat-containing surface-anchored protein [Enterococcus hulanensis]|uniref:SpaA isopeptide-forming pilin-related protein n=1 Tax=Enterococcus hulanensis TaxID=2559929 RepID=UPI001A8CDCB0|nr:SpaA isopeptide-forming pilin-related protein [Enterococcus hulanensis]MBO0455822.1 VaFE repeat-containing surface-anchored protein [Enterococcus hulanensis]
MKRIIKKIKKPRFLFVVLGMAAMILSMSVSSQSASAASDELQMKPGETGNIYYDTGNIYTMYGTKHGVPWSDSTAAMAVSPDDGSAQKVVFCIEPGVPFNSTNNPDYEAVAIQDLPQDAQIASVVWNTFYAFGDNWTNADRITTQAVIWEMLPQYGIKVDSISGIPDFATRRQTLLNGISEYKRLPEFDSTTVNLKYGETKTLNSSVNLNSFDELVGNTAKVNWNVAADGKSVQVTPTDPNVEEGRIAYLRSFMHGTPIAMQKAGSQTVYLPSISDPNAFQVSFKIQTTGDVEIMKLDKDSGKALPNFKFEVSFPDRKDLSTQTVTTNSNGKATVKNVPHGVRVIAKEVFAPAPYVLGSAIGESDQVEGIVEAGKTITLTKKNKQAKGQITVEKSGKESNKDMWNDNYTLDQTTFEVRKDKVDGPIVETFKTDAKGFGKSTPNLDLGVYYLVESQAGNGFANTFEPKKIDITYKNQTIAVVIENEKGTNQEVTGNTLLTKEDAETGSETQGKATFDGAVYGLFHEDDTPVKESDNYKPVVSKGNKIDGDEMKFEISDKEQQAGVDHLALGNYYWQELVAPEGYQIDNTKHKFSITYKDQDTKVIEAKTTSKENVIKFDLDGFKYVDSKSGDTKTGYNGLEFKLTPIDPTKGEERIVETITDENGYDGYWSFNDVPFGDYWLTEVKAPEGYKTINPLKVESSFNKETREYVWTITEKDQKEPIKTLTVPESKINEGSNVISLSKLFFTNKLVKAPQIGTMATVNGEKTYTLNEKTPMHDKISLKDLEVGASYTLKEIKLWEIQDKDYKNAKVVYETEKDFVADKENMELVVETLIDTSKNDENTSYVWTEKLNLGEQEVADHEDLTNEDQTVRPVMPNEPKTETLFATIDGKKDFDVDKDTKFTDKVSQDFPETEIGKLKHWVHDLHSIDKDGKDTVIEQVFETREVKAGKEEFDVSFEYVAKKHKLKDGEKLVVTHVAYNDEEHKEEYVRHFDLKNEKQTVTGKKIVTTPESKSTPPTTTKGVLPQTAGMLTNPYVWIAALALVAGAIFLFKNRKEGQEK